MRNWIHQTVSSRVPPACALCVRVNLIHRGFALRISAAYSAGGLLSFPLRNKAQRKLNIQNLGLLASHEHHRPSGLLPWWLSNRSRKELSILLYFKHLPEVPDLGISSLESILPALKCSLHDWSRVNLRYNPSLKRFSSSIIIKKGQTSKLSAQYEYCVYTQVDTQEWALPFFLLVRFTL